MFDLISEYPWLPVVIAVVSLYYVIRAVARRPSAPIVSNHDILKAEKEGRRRREASLREFPPR